MPVPNDAPSPSSTLLFPSALCAVRFPMSAHGAVLVYGFCVLKFTVSTRGYAQAATKTPEVDLRRLLSGRGRLHYTAAIMKAGKHALPMESRCG